MSIESIKNGITSNPLVAVGAAAGAGVIAGAGIGILAASAVGGSSRSKSRASRKKGARIKHTKRGWKQDRARKSKQKWEVSYRRRKAKMKRKGRRGKVYYAKKTGQPYILLANGKAKFIKGKRRAR